MFFLPHEFSFFFHQSHVFLPQKQLFLPENWFPVEGEKNVISGRGGEKTYFLPQIGENFSEIDEVFGREEISQV